MRGATSHEEPASKDFVPTSSGETQLLPGAPSPPRISGSLSGAARGWAGSASATAAARRLHRSRGMNCRSMGFSWGPGAGPPSSVTLRPPWVLLPSASRGCEEVKYPK